MTPNKLLFRLPIVLIQIKAGNSLYKLKNDQNHQKSLQQFNQVFIIMEENMIMLRDPKTFCLSFDWSKDVDENLKHKIEFL